MASIRLVPQVPPAALGIADARDAAKNAYARARKAQRTLMARMCLIDLLYREGSVSYERLKGERSEAQRQVERAQAVLDHLNEAIEVMETTAQAEGLR